VKHFDLFILVLYDGVEKNIGLLFENRKFTFAEDVRSGDIVLKAVNKYSSNDLRIINECDK